MKLSNLKIRARFQLLLGLFVVGFGLYAVWSFGTIQESVGIAQSFAAGDLSTNFKPEGNSELTQLLTALQDMQGSLAGVVSRVREGS